MDYGTFAQMLCNGGTLNGKRILGRKSIELMTANHMITLPNNQAATRQRGGRTFRGPPQIARSMGCRSSGA